MELNLPSYQENQHKSADLRESAPPGQSQHFPNQPFPCMNGNPQIVYAYKAPSSNVYDKFKGSQSVGNGIFQIFVGLLCIGFNSGSIAVGLENYYQLLDVVGYGIWGGVIFLVAGSLGISAGTLKTKCLIISFMVLCIISCAVTVVIFSLSILNLLFSIPEGYTLQTALTAVLLSLSIAEAVLGIWGSILCCSAACCGAPKMFVTTAPLQFTQGNPQVIVMGNPQTLNPSQLHQGHIVQAY